jgi:hypothetical protein
MGEWLAAARTGYHPVRSVFAIPWEVNDSLPAYLPRLVSAEQREGVVAYRCQGMTCSPPFTDLAAFRAALKDA